MQSCKWAHESFKPKVFFKRELPRVTLMQVNNINQFIHTKLDNSKINEIFLTVHQLDH